MIHEKSLNLNKKSPFIIRLNLSLDNFLNELFKFSWIHLVTKVFELLHCCWLAWQWNKYIRADDITSSSFVFFNFHNKKRKKEKKKNTQNAKLVAGFFLFIKYFFYTLSTNCIWWISDCTIANAHKRQIAMVSRCWHFVVLLLHYFEKSSVLFYFKTRRGKYNMHKKSVGQVTKK